jgi:peptide/nickel transport system substrate-binding protein
MSSETRKRVVLGIVILSLFLPLPMWASGQGSPDAQAKKEIVVGLPALPTALDNTLRTANSCIAVVFSIFDTLIFQDVNDGYKLKPMLATSWKRLSDKGLELKLRPGVKWHNGDSFTSADVRFSLERVINETKEFALARGFLNVIDRIETPDDLTVRIFTKNPDPVLEYRLSSPWGAHIFPQKYTQTLGYEEFGRQPVGTGPFKFKRMTTTEIEVERFENYWGPKPNVDRITYRYIPEVSARITALVNGEVDIITNIPPDQYSSLTRYSDQIQIKPLRINSMHLLVFNLNNSVSKSKPFRQALSLAIDRKMLADTLWLGKTTIPRGRQFEAYGDMYLADYPYPEYNLEKAKTLLAQSGYAGEEVNYITHPTYYTNAVPVGEAIVEMWKKLGVNAKLRIDQAGWQVPNEERELVNWSNGFRFPDPLGDIWLLWGPVSSPQVTMGWNPERFNKLGSELEITANLKRRKEIFKEMLQIFDEDAAGVVLYYVIETYAWRKSINWRPGMMYEMDFSNSNFSFTK